MTLSLNRRRLLLSAAGLSVTAAAGCVERAERAISQSGGGPQDIDGQSATDPILRAELPAPDAVLPIEHSPVRVLSLARLRSRSSVPGPVDGLLDEYATEHENSNIDPRNVDAVVTYPPVKAHLGQFDAGAVRDGLDDLDHLTRAGEHEGLTVYERESELAAYGVGDGVYVQSWPLYGSRPTTFLKAYAEAASGAAPAVESDALDAVFDAIGPSDYAEAVTQPADMEVAALSGHGSVQGVTARGAAWNFGAGRSHADFALAFSASDSESEREQKLDVFRGSGSGAGDATARLQGRVGVVTATFDNDQFPGDGASFREEVLRSNLVGDAAGEFRKRYLREHGPDRPDVEFDYEFDPNGETPDCAPAAGGTLTVTHAGGDEFPVRHAYWTPSRGKIRQLQGCGSLGYYDTFAPGDSVELGLPADTSSVGFIWVVTGDSFHSIERWN